MSCYRICTDPLMEHTLKESKVVLRSSKLKAHTGQPDDSWLEDERRREILLTTDSFSAVVAGATHGKPGTIRTNSAYSLTIWRSLLKAALLLRLCAKDMALRKHGGCWS